MTNYATNRKGSIFDRRDQQISRLFSKKIIVIIKFVLIEDWHYNGILLFIISEIKISFFFLKNICVFMQYDAHYI